MTIEDWEAVNATLLWIHLKAGLLPLDGEVPGACEKEPSSSSPRTKQGSRRSCEKSRSEGRRTLRLFLRLRLVGSRHEKGRQS
jgi:hypothetical protein